MDTPTTITLTPEHYWRLRTRLLEHQQLLRDQEQRRDVVETAMKALCAEVGLVEGVSYNLDDATLTASVAKVP